MTRSLPAAVLAASVLAAAPAAPARAQWIVFDPSNYAENVLTAARALEQIQNQIQSLQNEATMLLDMARNLQHLDYSSLGQITTALSRIDGLMGQAQGLSFDVAQSQSRWQAQYPAGYDATVTSSDLTAQAQVRWQDAMAAFGHTVAVQSQIAANVQADGPLLGELVSQSQSAEGALQANQAIAQLIALSTKQQLQLQTLIAAQYRAQTEDLARKAQAEEAARVATRRFIGAPTAYTER